MQAANKQKCVECNRQASQTHHAIKKGKGHSVKAAYLDHNINKFPMCTSCHTELHKSPFQGLDLKYRVLVYKTLKSLFTAEYYSLEQIQTMLEYTPEQSRGLTKSLNAADGNYSREEIIRKLMGGGIHPNILEEAGGLDE